MGYPEIPSENDNQVLGPPPSGVILDVDMDTNNDSDDDDGAYDGYQPLGVMDDDMSDIDQADTMDANDLQMNNGVAVDDEERTTTVDTELEREVWSAPRPDLTNIHLDESRAAQIMSLMTQINLPANSIPEWAKEVSDDKWKEDLLDKIRKRTQQ